MLNALEVEQHLTNKGIMESPSSSKIPWKPVLATGSESDTVLVPSEVDSTALSILYASEYVNGIFRPYLELKWNFLVNIHFFQAMVTTYILK